MSRAAPEPQLDSPVEDRLGYLTHVRASLEVISPDSLHGAAHLAPLTGLELPFLDMLADLNDAVLEAGRDADLDQLTRIVAACRQRVDLEALRLAGSGSAPEQGTSRAQRLATIRRQGEVMTAEIMLVANATSLLPAVVSRVRRLLAEPDDHPATQLAALAALAVDLEQEHLARAWEHIASLLATLDLEPLTSRPT